MPYKIKSGYIFFIAIQLLCFIAGAQQINFKHYTTNDGLPSSSVYTCIQDSKGFMWFGTDKGVALFDGNSFKNFNLTHGLPSNAVFSFNLSHDTLLLGCRFGFRLIVNRNRVIPFPVDSEEVFINTAMHKTKDFIYSVSIAQKTIIYDLRKRQIIHDTLFSLNYKNLPLWVSATNTGEVLELRMNGLYKFNGTNKTKVNIPQLNNHIIESFHCSTDGVITILCEKRIYYLKNYKVVDSVCLPDKFGQSGLKIIRTKAGDAWVYGREGELYKVGGTKPHAINSYNEIFKQPKIAINFVYEDNKGNIWVTTHNNGVFCIYNSFSKHYDGEDGLTGIVVHDIDVDAGQNMYIASDKGVYTKQPSSQFVKTDLNTNFTYRFCVLGKNLVACQSAPAGLVQTSLSLKKMPGTDYDSLTFRLVRRMISFKHIIAYGLWNHSVLFTDTVTGNTKEIVIDKRNARICEIFTNDGVNFWVGSTKGLYHINYVTGQVHKIGLVTSTVMDICDAPYNRLYVAAEDGFYVLQDNRWYKTVEYKGKETINFMAFARDNKSRTWAATNKGILIGDGNNYLQEITGYPDLLSNEVSCLKFDSKNNKMYVGTNAGVTVIDVALMDSLHKNPPDVELLYVQANDTVYDHSGPFTVSGEKPNATLFYTAIEYNVPKNLIFRYRVDNGTWLITKEHNLSFIDIKPGNHKVELQASVDQIHWGRVTSITMNVPVQIYQTIWFYLFLVALCFVIMLYFFKLRLRSIRRKNAEKTAIQNQLEQLRYQALDAAVNPHFIFNALGSIQSYVTSNDPFKASDYIAKFSRLIRITLNHAGDKYISVQEEITRIGIYLELEKLRCGNRMEYTIELADNIDLKGMIPNMLIQPLLENAIIHGVLQLPAKEVGYIKVGISKDENRIVIIIEDNGKGYDPDRFSKHGYKSIGLSNIAQRLQNIPGSFFSIRNKKELFPNATGTIATIILPIV